MKKPAIITASIRITTPRPPCLWGGWFCVQKAGKIGKKGEKPPPRYKEHNENLENKSRCEIAAQECVDECDKIAHYHGACDENGENKRPTAHPELGFFRRARTI